MRIISEANGKIMKLWGSVKLQPDRYRFLTYVISTEVETGMLLHNVVTGELIFLDTDEATHLSGLPFAYAPWMDELIQKHFLVRTKSDDKKTVDGLRLALKLSETSKEITGYTILPTTNCNARCFYCYEARCKHETMTDETADKLVAFMETHRGNKPLGLNWFGGEPLVGIRQIDRICKVLNGKNIPFHSDMISNGYLFDEEIVNRAKAEWHLKKIQVTLDGTEKIYNETKAYIHSCESPYRKVLDNIGFLLQNGIKVSIRLNLGLHNADDLNHLIDELADKFQDRTNLDVYSNVLTENCGFAPAHFGKEKRAVLAEQNKMLTEKIMRYGDGTYLEDLPKLTKNRCMSDNDATLMVLPSGKLGKCEHYVDSHFIGNLDDGITDKSEQNLLRERVVCSDCATCPAYPACIELKLCESYMPCTETKRQLFADKTVQVMKKHYEANLHGEPNSFKTQDTTIC